MRGGDIVIERKYDFAIDKIEKLNLEQYPDDEFAVVKLGFLSTAPNAHKLDISEKVLRDSSNSALGKFVVAKILLNDTMGHENNQNIFGYVPMEQEIEFIEEDEYLRASCLAVISKIYAEDFYDILNRDGEKSISVEMSVTTPEDDESNVLSFRIFGITVLGQRIKPSCPNSSISFVRFSEEKAKDFYNKLNKNSGSKLYQFAQSRKEQYMAEEKKTYEVDKSKESLSTKSWGEVDKNDLRDKIMEASNRDSLVKDVYMLVEEGWEEAPSEHLKYPVMCFEGDTLVYNRDGLSSALGYAKKENETAVISKVEKIYKELGLETDGKEEKEKMSQEIKFAAVDITDMWGKVYDALHTKYPDGDWGSVYRIDGIYEENSNKFALIHHKDEDALYRLDFTLTEEGLTLSDEVTKVEIEIKETEEIRKFAEPEDADKYKKFEKEETPPEDTEAKMAQLQADVESRDNIIMEKDKELETLRNFKKAVEDKEKAMSVEAVMADVKDCLEEVKFSELHEEGLKCEMNELDAWANKVKAVAFSAVKKPKNKKSPLDVWTLSAPLQITPSEPTSVWERLKNKAQ